MKPIYRNKNGFFSRLEEANESIKKVTYKRICYFLILINIFLLWYIFSIILVARIALRIF